MNKKSTLEVIVQQIKGQIKKGILKPGEKLPSERKFEVSLFITQYGLGQGIFSL